MSFCPKCRDDFEDRVKICPDDGVPLVSELPQGREAEREPLEDSRFRRNDREQDIERGV
jgi:hypothetical protein